MAILAKLCPDCGKEIINKKHTYCRVCGLKHKYRKQGLDWTPEEEIALISYVQTCINIAKLRQQALAIRRVIAVRHSTNTVHNKLNDLREKGIIGSEQWRPIYA